jgi:CHAT domain
MVKLIQIASSGDVAGFVDKMAGSERAATPTAAGLGTLENLLENIPHSTSPMIRAVVDGMSPGYTEASKTFGEEELGVRVEEGAIWTMRPTFRWANVDQRWRDQWEQVASKVPDTDPELREHLLRSLAYSFGTWNFLVPKEWRVQFGSSLASQLSMPKDVRSFVDVTLELVSNLDVGQSPSLKCTTLSVLGDLAKLAFQARNTGLSVDCFVPLVSILRSEESSGTKELQIEALSDEMGPRLAGFGQFVLSDAERNLRESAPPSSAVPPQGPEGPEAEVEGEREPPPRFADITLFHDKDKKRGRKLYKNEPLQVDSWYQLEVAIRERPLGLDTEQRRRPIRSPKQKDTVRIWATLAARPEKKLEVDNYISEIALPPAGDSTKHAIFRIRPSLDATGAADNLWIDLRLYFKFNLLEHMTIKPEVVLGNDSKAASRLGVNGPIVLTQHAVGSYLDFDNIHPRHMNIEISHREGMYHFAFLISNEVAKSGDADEDESQQIRFDASVSLEKGALSDCICRTRKLWNSISLGAPYATQLIGDTNQFCARVRQLAKLGRDCFTMLSQSIDSDIQRVRNWLQEHPPANDSVIQISISKDARSFVFPWCLLYDGKIPSEDWKIPDLSGFWGMRYSIEQRPDNYKPASEEPLPTANPLEIQFIAREAFSTYRSQHQMFDDFRNQAGGRLNVSRPPLTTKNLCMQSLLNCNASILYFHTHGHTRMREDDVGSLGSLANQVKLLQLAGEADAARKIEALALRYASQKYELDRSWIEPSQGFVYLDDLAADVKNRFNSSPVVILNMCESAQVTATLSDSFIDFFIDRGASSVLGTECSMSLVFADNFAKSLLGTLLSGESLGTAILRARRDFMRTHRNPLGFAYTLFGTESVRFAPPPIESTLRTIDSVVLN